jgi:hypothetical protein
VNPHFQKVGGETSTHTFCIGWKVNFYNLAVEAKDGLEVGLDDITREIGDYNDLGIWLCIRLLVHVHVDAARLGGGRTPLRRHCWMAVQA